MNLTEAVDFEYPEKDMAKPLKNITLAEADSTETFTFKPFEYERGVVTKTTKGVINTIRDMQDLPEQVKIFGKRLSFGFGGYFGDTEEETERKKLNLITAERNLNEAQAERYRFSSQKETESLAYGVGGGIVNYGTMLLPAGAVGGALKVAGKTAKAVKGAEAAGLSTMGVMELAGQVQDKTPMKDGEIDVEAMTPEWARKATGGTIAYTGISALTEKYVGFGQQIKMWNKPIKWGGNVTSKALTTLKTAGLNALSEGMTEGIQDLEATGIGLIDGTLEMDKLPARLQQAWKSAIIGGIIGGGVGTAAAMKSARNVKKQLRDMVAPVVGEEDAQTVAEAIYDAGTDDMTKAISIELELSSELKNKHGKVWNSMLKAVSKEMEGKPRFERMTEDERAHYANTVAKHFADNVLAEANYRGTTLDAILKDSDIRYDKGLKIARHINLYDALKNPEMIPAETKLRKKGTSLIQFLRNSGGIQDEGGNLKSREAQKQYIGLINKNGMTLDDAALLAWQEGYLPDADFNYGRPDINALLDAIDEGLRGNHRYNVVEDETRTFKDALEDLKEQLDNMGIDWQNMTAAEIEKAVNEIPEMESLEREYEFYENYEPEIGLNEDEEERLAIMTEGKEYPVIDDKDLPFYYQLTDEMAQLDAENPAYDGETININGQEKTVYNSDGERIAQSEAALRNFYNWFGDSKVVDKQGRPLVVYHGTNAEFDTFKGTKILNSSEGVGFNFAVKKDIAEGFGKVMPVYLKLENPVYAYSNIDLVSDTYEDDFEIENQEAIRNAVYKVKENLEQKGYTFYNEVDSDMLDAYAESSQAQEVLDGLLDLGSYIQEDYDAETLYNDIRQAEIDAFGIDGYVTNNYGATGGKVYIAFKSNQIKSTQNRGTYSESDNIYYQTDNKIYSVFDLKVGDNLKAFGKVEEIDNKERKIKIGGEWYSMFMIDSEAQRGGLTLGEKESIDIDEDIDNYEVKVAKGDRTAVEEQKSKNAEYNKLAKEYYGTTNKLSETGYILTDGSLLDFSGKKFGGSPNNRSIDHREIVDALDKAGMEEFINSGNIRYLPEGDKILLSNEPTPQQYKVIERIINNNGGYITIELMNDAEKWGMNRNDYYGEYEDTTFNKVKRDIKAFYTGEGVREITTFFQSAFAGSRVDYDRPSLEAIGSGEGAQVHGWGLYYALNKDVAERYRRNFVRGATKDVYDGEEIKYLRKTEKEKKPAIYRVAQDFFYNTFYDEADLNRAKLKAMERWYEWDLSMAKRNGEKKRAKIAQENLEALKTFDMSKAREVEAGQVHEVDLPENPYLLDEQKTFSEQSEFVKEKLENAYNDLLDMVIGKLPEEKQEETRNHILNGERLDNLTVEELQDLKIAAVNDFYKQKDDYLRGRDIYNDIKSILGKSAKDASQFLEKHGIKGITYEGTQDGRCFVIFNPKDVKVIQKFYQGEEAPKGYTNITPDEYIIKLLEGADESTLPHELAHYWLNEMWNYTRTGRASENYMKRWQIISDYLGITPEQNRLTQTQQEKFASSYEAYLTRGELPTPLIGSVFDDYDKWLQRVYNDYNSINYHVRKGKKVYSHPIRLTDAAIKFFQSMTTGTLEPPALAPKNTGVAIPQEIEIPEVAEPTNEIVETPTTYDTTRVINITEGEKGVSKVFKREAMKHADRIVDELGVSYNKINLEEQAVKAAEWVQNNLEEARKVVNGAAAPEGIIDTAIFIAYENEMLRIGNNAEYQRALKIHSQVQTQRGQAIAAERITTDDVYNPAYWWKKLQNHKETQVAQQLFKGDVKALNEAIETETKSIMKEIAGKPKEEQVKALSELAEKLQKDYNLETLYQMPDDINERTVREFIKDTLGVNPDVMAGNEVINKAEQLQKLWENTTDKSGNPSVEAMRAKRELNDLIQAQTPSNALAIWTSIFGRGVMLTSVKSPVLNIISNIEAGFTEGITRRIMYGTTEKAVDKSVKEEFSKYAWEVYKASSDIVTTMNDYDDDMRIIGEQILHSQGKGILRAASRKVEEISFKYLMGAPDVVAKTYAFNDTADLLATKIAREEGAKDISKRATEIYKDAILIKPVTEQGQAVRKQAQEQAHYTTFTNDSWASKFGLSARNWLNMVGRNKVRLGDLTMKFVKTPANVQMMGLEYGFGLLYTTYHVQDIIKNPQSETSKIAIRAAVRNGLGIALAALLYSMLDPDDYFSEFDTLNPREKDRMRAMGAIPNSIKIGNRWVSLDYFGQLGIPLVGMLEARKNNGLRNYVQSGLTQAAKIPGIKETKQLIDSMSEYARYDLKPEKIAQMMAGTVLDQARAMTIPAIVNDIAKMTDDYERDTSGAVMNKVISSIPGLRRTLPERYGIQGLVRTEPGLSTLLFGSRVKTAQEDKLVREVEKLSKKDAQPSISDVTKYGDLRLLSPEKKVKVRQEFYKLYNGESKKLISTREYQKMTEDNKKKALNKVRSRVVKSLKEKYSNDIQREKRRL